MVHQTKSTLTLELMNQTIAWDLPRGVVLADSFYSNDFAFRTALREKQLNYAVVLEPTTVVWPDDPNQAPVIATGRIGRLRRHPRTQDLPTAISLEKLVRKLAKKAWRIGTKGPQRSRFALTGV